MDNIEFDVKMTVGTLFNFKVQHAYKQAITILATCAGFVLCFLFFTKQQTSLIYPIIGAILIFYVPVTNFYNAFMQVKLVPGFQKPLHYRICEEGIEVSQDEEKQMLAWNEVVKATGNQKSIFVYSSKRAAFIFPRACMGEYTIEVIAMIARNIPPQAMKIRY